MFIKALNLYEIIGSLKFLSVNKAVGQDNIQLSAQNSRLGNRALYFKTMLFQVGFSQIF